MRGSYSCDAPRQCKPLRLTKTIPLSTRLSSTRGLYGSWEIRKPRHMLVCQLVKVTRD